MPDHARALNEPLLDSKLAQLEESRAWSARVISRLEALLRTADDYDLFRINPLAYAAERGVAEREAVDLFLHGTRVGLFEMDWHLVCPVCAHIVESFPSLSHAHSRFHCNTCWAETTTTMDDSIQVTFTVSPQVRAITYHQPEQLGLEDFCLRYTFPHGIRSLPTGHSLVDFFQAHTLVSQWLAPQETVTVALDIVPGTFHLASDLSSMAVPLFAVDDEPSTAPQTIHVAVLADRLALSGQPTSAHLMEINGVTFKIQQFGALHAGAVQVVATNDTSTRRPFSALNIPPGAGPAPVAFEHPVLSGTRLLTNQTFRTLFRTETTATEGIAVRDTTLLFSDLKGSTELYDRIGDPQAFYLVRQHFDAIEAAVTRHGGSIVKTVGDAVMATFMTPREALEAALAMLAAIEHFNAGISTPLILKLGLHTGHAIVVTLNDRLDYFGQTVNVAARVQALAEAGEICLTEAVYLAPSVQEVLTERVVQHEQADLRGVRAPMGIYRLPAREPVVAEPD
jgi:class 3 adenylate cyclase